MKRLNKEGWLSAIEFQLQKIEPFLKLDHYERERLLDCPIITLAVIENIIAGIVLVTCSVGCGSCEACRYVVGLRAEVRKALTGAPNNEKRRKTRSKRRTGAR